MIIRAFKSGNCTIIYIFDAQHLNIIYIISYFEIFPCLRELFPLQHICYYFNMPTPYNWTLHVVYYLLFAIHLLFSDRENRDYSRFLFDYIAYLANNKGKHCIFVINIHTCKCTTLIFILTRFGLSHWYNIQDNKGWLFLYSPTRCWQVCVRLFSFYSIQLLLWLLSFGASIASL